MVDFLIRPSAAPVRIVRSGNAPARVIGTTGPPGPAGAAAGRVAAVAGQALSGHRVVTFDSSGLAVYADNATASHAWASVGVTTAAAASGSVVEVAVTGEIIEPSWSWAPGLPVFVGANGALTQTAPQAAGVFCRVIGAAKNATSLLVGAQIPVFIA